MNPVELFNQVNKDELGEYLDKAKDLVANSKGLNDVINKVKSIF